MTPSATCDRGRVRVVGVGLVTRARQRAHLSREPGRHVDHGLACLNELAGEQPTQTVGVLHRPDAFRPGRGEPLQPADLLRIRDHTELAQDLVVLAERHRGVGALVRIDPDDDRHLLLLVVGTVTRGGQG